MQGFGSAGTWPNGWRALPSSAVLRSRVLASAVSSLAPAEGTRDRRNHCDGKQPRMWSPTATASVTPCGSKSLAWPSAGAGISTSRVYHAALNTGCGPGPTGTGWRVRPPFRRARVLLPDGEHVWPPGWCVGPRTKAEYLVVRPRKKGGSAPIAEHTA